MFSRYSPVWLLPHNNRNTASNWPRNVILTTNDKISNIKSIKVARKAKHEHCNQVWHRHKHMCWIYYTNCWHHQINTQDKALTTATAASAQHLVWGNTILYTINNKQNKTVKKRERRAHWTQITIVQFGLR